MPTWPYRYQLSLQNRLRRSVYEVLRDQMDMVLVKQALIDSYENFQRAREPYPFVSKRELKPRATENPEIVLLDIRLSGINGCDVCREIRRFSDVPIIMLSVLDADIDESQALEAGADDYICKPFSVMILLSHVQAVLRRAQRSAIR